MKNWLIVGVIVLVAYYAYQSQTPSFESSENADVVLFTGDRCAGWCDKARNTLSGMNISVEEVNIHASEENQARFDAVKTKNTIPILFTPEGSYNGYNEMAYYSLIADAVGPDVLPEPAREIFNSHWDTSGYPLLVMYGSLNCNCYKTARNYFRKNNIDFEQRIIEKDETYKEQFYWLEGKKTPIVYYGNLRFDDVLKKLDKIKAAVE